MSLPAPTLIDSHCHLTWKSFDDDIDAVVGRMAEAGIARAVVVATTPDDAQATAALAKRFDALAPTTGIHPSDLPPKDELRASLARVDAHLHSGAYVAVGETGLDYYRDHHPLAVQQEAFEAQCGLAVKHDVPVVVHIRDKAGAQGAYDDVADIIDRTPGLRGVIHCYTGDPAHAERYLAAGMHVSFSGIVTFPKGDNVRESARVVPLARMLVETDAPFLAPVPHRGKRNEPAYVADTAAALAAWLDVSLAELAAQTTRNAATLFGLTLP